MITTMPARLLKVSLFAGSLYFFLVSLVHLFGCKVPALFIYYNVDSYVYQDRIISLLAFGWSAMYFMGAVLVSAGHHKYIIFHIFAGAFAVGVLAIINASPEILQRSGQDHPLPYWIMTWILGLYLLWVLLLYVLTFKANDYFSRTGDFYGK